MHPTKPGVADAVRRLGAVVGAAGVGLCTSNLRPIVEATLQAGGVAHAFGGGTTVQANPKTLPNSQTLKYPKLPSKHVSYTREILIIEKLYNPKPEKMEKS
jgi:hypothetical protein